MNKLRKRHLHPAITVAVDEGVKAHASNTKTVRVMAKVIAETMEELHGGRWRVEIDHRAGFVLIVPNLTREVRA